MRHTRLLAVAGATLSIVSAGSLAMANGAFADTGPAVSGVGSATDQLAPETCPSTIALGQCFAVTGKFSNTTHSAVFGDLPKTAGTVSGHVQIDLTKIDLLTQCLPITGTLQFKATKGALKGSLLGTVATGSKTCINMLTDPFGPQKETIIINVVGQQSSGFTGLAGTVMGSGGSVPNDPKNSLGSARTETLSTTLALNAATS